MVSGQSKEEGVCTGQVLGTYVHGLFDRQEAAVGLVKALALRRGMDPAQVRSMDYADFKEKQYDLLAATLRKHLDLEAIYRLMGLEARPVKGYANEDRTGESQTSGD